MSTKTSLVINAVNDGKQIQKTLTDINPAADNTALKVWGQMLNGLTTNTYVKTDRIDKTNCDSVVEKLTPSLIINETLEDGLVRSWLLQGRSIRMAYTGDGELMIVNNDETSWVTTFRTSPSAGLCMYIGVINSATEANATAPHDIVVRSVETDNYKAGEWKFSIIEG